MLKKSFKWKLEMKCIFSINYNNCNDKLKVQCFIKQKNKDNFFLYTKISLFLNLQKIF